MSKHNFHEKIALVTGGTKGIGKATVLELLECNAKVALCYSRDDLAAQQFEELLKNKYPNKYLIQKTDVSNRTQVKNLLTNIENKWASPVSLLVNNAGILKQGNFFELTDEQWDNTIHVNLKSAFILAQECIPKMNIGDSIVNLSSIGGQTGGDKAPDYAASKAGLISLTRSLARIGSKFGVRSNAVAPGWIETDIFDHSRLDEIKAEAREKILLGRLGQPEEVAKVIRFLLSDEASFITGHTLNINGGMYFG